jgi:hypothetical protein
MLFVPAADRSKLLPMLDIPTAKQKSAKHEAIRAFKKFTSVPSPLRLNGIDGAPDGG